MTLRKGALAAAMALCAAGAAHSLAELARDPAAIRRIRAWRLGARFSGTGGVVLQRESNDCGPAALAMVLRHHGRRPSLRELTRLASPGPRGVRMHVLESLAARFGLEARCRSLAPEELSRGPFPLIAFWSRGHFVVVERVSEDGTIVVADPALGRLRFPSSAFRRHWPGPALLVQPAERLFGRRRAAAPQPSTPSFPEGR